jgi:hypothetical protein
MLINPTIVQHMSNSRYIEYYGYHTIPFFKIKTKNIFIGGLGYIENSKSMYIFISLIKGSCSSKKG